MFFKKQKPDQASVRPRRGAASMRRKSIASSRTPRPTTTTLPRSPVYSYRASRSQRQETFGRVSPEQAEQVDTLKVRFRWLRSVPGFAASFVLIGLVYMGVRLDPHATVIPVDDAQGQVFLRSLKTYEKAAQHTFNASWLNGNKLTVNTAQISHDIKRQFPELKTVSISLPLTGNRPVVYVQPAVPALTLTSRTGSVYIIDTEGKALIQDDRTAHHRQLKLPNVTDDSGLVIVPGRIALPKASVTFIAEVTKQLQAQHITIASLTLPAGTGELDVRIAGEVYYVKCNLHGNAREEAGGFVAVKHSLDAGGRKPGQYIDVRVPGKAYYK